MNKLLVLFLLTLSLMGFNTSSYATEEGAEVEQATSEESKEKKKGGDEEPECD